MINLTSSTHELRIKLSAASSPPNECHCVTNYRQTTDTTYAFGSNATLSDGINSKTLLYGSSAGSAIRVVDDISIYNPDASVDITVIFYNGSTEWILVKQTLAQYETLTYNDKYGWKII